MKKLLSAILFCNCFTLLAQPAIQWQKTIGGDHSDEPKCIIQTNDGGFIVTGSTLSNSGDISENHGVYDFWVVKLSYLGSIEWQKTFGGSNNEWPYAIQQTTDDGYILAGFTTSNDGDVSGNHGDRDAWIVKIDNTGELEWQKTFGGTKREEARSIQQTMDGGYIFAGMAQSTDGDVIDSNGYWDFWVVKITSNGSIEWQNTLGGSSEDVASAVIQTSDGGYLVTGDTQSNDGDAQGNHGNLDYMVAKLSNNGTLEWSKTLGGSSADFGNDVQQTADGGYLIAGHAGTSSTGDITNGHGSLDVWIVKLSNSGVLQWQKAIGGSDNDRCEGISPTNDGMYVTIGTTQSSDSDIIDNDGGIDILIVKINESGEIIWQKTLGGTQAEAGYHIQQTSDNGYILTGYTWSTDGDLTGSTIQGYNDFWVVKLAPETVGTNETPQPSAGQLELFPNPAQQSITLKTSSDATELAVVLIDGLGRRLLEKIIPNGGALHIASLPDGVYWVQATDDEGKMYSAKLNKKE